MTLCCSIMQALCASTTASHWRSDEVTVRVPRCFHGRPNPGPAGHGRRRRQAPSLRLVDTVHTSLSWPSENSTADVPAMRCSRELCTCRLRRAMIYRPKSTPAPPWQRSQPRRSCGYSSRLSSTPSPVCRTACGRRHTTSSPTASSGTHVRGRWRAKSGPLPSNKLLLAWCRALMWVATTDVHCVAVVRISRLCVPACSLPIDVSLEPPGHAQPSGRAVRP